jgi:formyltetrahydrofolate deformylase
MDADIHRWRAADEGAADGLALRPLPERPALPLEDRRLPIDIVGVVSNHFEYQKVVVNHDIPFHHIKVTKANKPQAEAQIMDAGRADRHRADRAGPLHAGPVGRRCAEDVGQDHQHPPLLPAESFKGANPYKQAYERGVKLIGATAHYVTADLDEGPIIEQDTARITHAQSADDYVSIGRDVESQVLARAIHAHIHHRTFINGNRTVVFPASPGSYASERMG